uniref:Uncharacterized protein n=1 Tax=Eutreptiella gymnastica TaxID=73025 RepID=A0A7S1IU75_9EUGL|mmetsp:Transcript_42454/g.76108  ORF Transcript_42454/g.76108 Transcript_42454/m.76108 type:complete len:102 (+) Transcript_42454:801-1106(+)
MGVSVSVMGLRHIGILKSSLPLCCVSSGTYDQTSGGEDPSEWCLYKWITGQITNGTSCQVCCVFRNTVPLLLPLAPLPPHTPFPSDAILESQYLEVSLFCG